MSGYGKNRYWTALAYPENMDDGWQDKIDGLLQLPFAYAIHDKGLEMEDGQERKVHVHVVIVFPGPTTYKHAMEVFSALSAPGKRAVNTCEPVYNVRRIWDYLIHDTEDARKKGKHLFRPEDRITGNNFDIGAYIQVSTAEKNEMFDKLVFLIFARDLTNFADFVETAYCEYPEEHDLCRDVIRGWSGYFERLITGSYHRVQSAIRAAQEQGRRVPEEMERTDD